LIESSSFLRKKEGKVWDACREGLLEHFGLSREDLERLDSLAGEWIEGGAV
jgi:hypothetical protein